MARLRGRIGAEQGFTLIELLVVIMIIGILAEIAIPSFLGQAPKAYDAAAKTAVRTAQIALESYRVEHGDYCGATVSDLVSIDATLNQAKNLTVDTCAGGNKQAYALSVTSRSNTATVYSISLAGGAVVSRTCNTPGEGGCSISGSW